MGKHVVDPRLKEHMPIIPVCYINTIQVDKFIVVWRMLKKQKHYIFTAKICSSLRQVIQYIPRNMHTVFALLCFVVVIHWLIFPYPSGLLHWHCGNLTIAPVPAKQPWWMWINTSCEFIMNDCITITKQSTTKPCAYFLGYTVWERSQCQCHFQAADNELHLKVLCSALKSTSMFTLESKPTIKAKRCNLPTADPNIDNELTIQ